MIKFILSTYLNFCNFIQQIPKIVIKLYNIVTEIET